MSQAARPRALGSQESGVRVVNAPRGGFRDAYHAFLRSPWWVSLGSIVVTYLVINACFALAYLALGGIEHARPGSFLDAFFFSVQTMGTIGYGAMYPVRTGANVLVVLESVTSLIVTAVATGLVFAKFSQSRARVVFTRQVAIAPMDGVPTLMFRVGNQRGNQIMEATVRAAMIRTERTKEGMTFYRLIDLPLSRERSPAVARSWTAMHPITPASPLFSQTPSSLKASEVEVIITLVGTDDTSLQPVYARHRYLDDEMVWGARHADILSEDEHGELVLDLAKFHLLVATEATPDFPYTADLRSPTEKPPAS